MQQDAETAAMHTHPDSGAKCNQDSHAWHRAVVAAAGMTGTDATKSMTPCVGTFLDSVLDLDCTLMPWSKTESKKEHKVQRISADMTLIAGTVPSLMEIVRGSLKCVLG